MDFSAVNAPVQPIELPFLKPLGVQLALKREDLLHPLISGNKFRKLKYNIHQARLLGKKQILTFGGAYSNHIAATAIAAQNSGMQSIGIIRGEELGQNISKTLATNPTLKFAYAKGMDLQFITRSEYRLKARAAFLSKLRIHYPDAYIVPEGGTNQYAIQGCREILNKKTADFDIVAVAVGTGGTFIGLAQSATPHQTIIGVPVVGDASLAEKVHRYGQLAPRHWLLWDALLGGYAKIHKDLIHFINDFKQTTGIALDPIYTGKMAFAIINDIKKGMFPRGSRILMIHTGGLQGIKGMNLRLKKRGLPLLL